MSIKLRKRKRRNNKYSLYLDIYHDGQRKFEHLNLFLEDNPIKNKATLKLAENVRAKRQLELEHKSYGFVSETRRKDDFVEYSIIRKRPLSWAEHTAATIYTRIITCNGIAIKIAFSRAVHPTTTR